MRSLGGDGPASASATRVRRPWRPTSRAVGRKTQSRSIDGPLDVTERQGAAPGPGLSSFTLAPGATISNLLRRDEPFQGIRIVHDPDETTTSFWKFVSTPLLGPERVASGKYTAFSFRSTSGSDNPGSGTVGRPGGSARTPYLLRRAAPSASIKLRRAEKPRKSSNVSSLRPKPEPPPLLKEKTTLSPSVRSPRPARLRGPAGSFGVVGKGRPIQSRCGWAERWPELEARFEIVPCRARHAVSASLLLGNPTASSSPSIPATSRRFSDRPPSVYPSSLTLPDRNRRGPRRGRPGRLPVEK